jgi:putative Mg2+ transporter-C (MgtC) family protein
MSGDPMILTEFDMILRLVLSFVAGGIIGLERSSRRQVAGLRTHILIATGATLLMLLSIYIPQHFNPERSSDPGRIAAQVVSGIGFLGAGAIIRLGNSIRGLTTAASLWFVAAVGLAIGAGMYVVAAAAEALGVIALMFLYVFEKKMFPAERLKLMEISYKNDQANSSISVREAMEIIKKAGMSVLSTDFNQSSDKKGSKLRLFIRIPGALDIASIAQSIKALDNVSRVEIKEKYS